MSEEYKGQRPLTLIKKFVHPSDINFYLYIHACIQLLLLSFVTVLCYSKCMSTIDNKSAANILKLWMAVDIDDYKYKNLS